MSLRLPQRCLFGAAGAVLVLAVTACGSHVAAGAPRIVHITERDFHISAPHHLAAGTIRFVVKNNGPVSHELIIVRAAPGPLPLRADGFTVNEETLEPRIIGSLEPDGPNAGRDLQVHLAPGRYIVFCNMAGHYMSGMSSVLWVR